MADTVSFSQKPLQHFKIFLVGTTGVGKKSLFLRLKNGEMTSEPLDCYLRVEYSTEIVRKVGDESVNVRLKINMHKCYNIKFLD